MVEGMENANPLVDHYELTELFRQTYAADCYKA